AIKNALEFCWRAYSKPAPESSTELLTLLLLCLVIAVVSGGLLFHWMFQTLNYEYFASSVMAGIYSMSAFLLLSLVHPVRCMFTIILPTLGTGQGLRLIMSSCVMLLVLNVIPNITANISVVTHVLECTSGTLTESLINSTQLVIEAKHDLIQTVIDLKQKENSINLELVKVLSNFDISTRIDASSVRQQFSHVSRQVVEGFSFTKMFLEEIKKVSNKILAAVFVFCILVGSACYLKEYLTNVKFDNIYITQQLERLAQENGIPILPTCTKLLINSRGCKMSQEEFFQCIPRLLVLTLYLILTVVVIILDQVVFWLVVASEPWLKDLPQILVSMDVKYKVQYYLVIWLGNKLSLNDLIDFHKVYCFNLSTMSRQCMIEPSKPDISVVLLIGFLYVLAYIVVVCEIYLRRMRRKVSSSFFKRQEEKRINFLYHKIVAKQEMERGGIFFINTTNGKM
ncbi:OCSTP protein, partial [Amia calva]|nr:OCSTP protein [Amia calva]